MTFPQPFAHESYMISSRRMLRRSRGAPSPHEQKHTALHRGSTDSGGAAQEVEAPHDCAEPRRNPVSRGFGEDVCTPRRAPKSSSKDHNSDGVTFSPHASHRLVSVPLKTAHTSDLDGPKGSLLFRISAQRSCSLNILRSIELAGVEN